MDLESIRQEIPATQKLVYMNTGWSGPTPRPVVERIEEALEFESYEGPTARPVMERRSAITRGTREAVARLLGATPEEICLTQNTTEGINIVMNGLGWQPGDQVVTCTLEHSSVLVPSLYLQKRRGVEVRIVALGGDSDKESLLQALEQAMGPRTRLVALSHIQYSNGLRMPLAEICGLARQRGAQVLVDAAQSAGQIRIDVGRLGCDYYSIPGHKWLLGPDGVGALFVRRDRIEELEPLKVAGAAAEYTLDGELRPRSDAIRKFELTTQNAPLFAGLTAAIEYQEALGLAEIESRSASLSRRAYEGLSALPGVRLHSPPPGELASGLVTFEVEGVNHRMVAPYLWEQARVVCRAVSEPPGTRLSLHFFNTEEELALALEWVGRIAREGVPEEFASRVLEAARRR